MRELTTDEKELNKKGIEKNQKKISKSKDQLAILKLQKEALLAKRKYEDFARPFEREAQDEEFKKTKKMLEDEIKQSEATIEKLNIQLNQGVESPNG